MEKQLRLLWIDGVKYMACIGVFLSHFCSAFIGENEKMDTLSPSYSTNIPNFFFFS